MELRILEFNERDFHHDFMTFAKLIETKGIVLLHDKSHIKRMRTNYVHTSRKI